MKRRRGRRAPTRLHAAEDVISLGSHEQGLQPMGRIRRGLLTFQFRALNYTSVG